METTAAPSPLNRTGQEEAQGDLVRQAAQQSEPAPVAAITRGASPQQGGFESGLQAEQARLLYEDIPAALLNNALLALVLASVLWPIAALDKLFGWLAVLVMILLARAALAVAWRRSGSNTATFAPLWLRRFRVAAIATGLAWGAGAALLFPSGDALHQVFIAFVLTGVSVGAITLLAVDRLSVIGFLALMLTPLAARFAMEGGLISVAMDAMIALYMIFVAMSATRVGRSLRENVNLRIEAIAREQVLRMRNQELSSVIESLPDNIIRYDLKCRAVYVNHMMEKTTNVLAAALIGKTPIESKFDGLVGVESYQAKLQRVIDSGMKEDVEVMVAGSAGKQRTHRIQMVAERGSDGKIIGALAFGGDVTEGKVTHYVATLQDITQHKVADEKINRLAFYDALTQLPNRRQLLDRLQHGLAASVRSGKRGALLFIDLDNFKTLNDSLGHDKGDLLLQQVAQRLTTCVREGDTVARLGDDEFVVMLENLSEQPRQAATEAENAGNKIIATLNQSYLLGGCECHSTQSIGITLFGGQQQSIDELMKQADLAMFRAKASGRNHLLFFDPEMQAMVTERAALEADVRRAMQENQILLHYQPQVDCNGRMTGVEALVRWQHPRRGMVMPGDFVSLAEDIGLILPIGLWVLETACAQLAAWSAKAETAHLTMSVNVSARQLLHPNFVDQVLAALDHSGASPSLLKLELTESLLVDNVEDTIIKMTALKSRGIRFSLDDFGTGYSSLSYLKRLPLDQLKIDQSFVCDVLNDPNDAAIARTIVTLAQSLGLGVIAEGVETEAQRDLLADYGCYTYQGYLFSRPLTAEQLHAFVMGQC